MPRIPLIIDTDPGVDDAVALVLAMHSPEVDIRAVTVPFGNVELEKTFSPSWPSRSTTTS